MDITDKKQAEQLIIEENKRLLELEELRKDLITRVSHELKTPMTSIFGTIQILLGIFREKLDKEALKYAKIGYRGCLRLKELIDNLLDASRLESKKFELRLQKEDLGILVDDCINDMSYLADTRKQTIEIDYPYKVEYEIDRLRFRQVITNIISNAIKNTPREGNIVISLNEKDVYIDIHVRDNGVGLTQKEKERLFEKFGKIERYGMDLDVDIEGCGLGLYISKEIVELHGGKILVESEGRNKGTTFTIRLFKR
jgi:signal transduction histidine kinase